MSSILDENIVLSLNGNWQALKVKSVRDAVTQLCSSDDGITPAALALDIHYHVNADGTVDRSQLVGMYPVPWSAWVLLPIRPWDSVIHSARQQIRVPTVIVAAQFRDMPKRHFKVSKHGVRERDNDTCQITGRRLKKGEGNVDHIIPSSRGGKDSWENLIYVDRKLNSQKGDKTLKEMGWTTIRQPAEPRPVPLSALIREARHADWNHFIIK